MKIALRAVAALKTYGLMAGGFALVGVVVGAFTAGPAIAQAVRAALVSNVDDPGRVPYQVGINDPVAFLDCSSVCVTEAPQVPAGKRLVITNVSGVLLTGLPSGSVILPSVLGSGNTPIYLGVVFSGTKNGSNWFTFNQPIRLFFDAGSIPKVGVTLGASTSGASFFTLSGYMLDCSTGPCAAIAP